MSAIVGSRRLTPKNILTKAGFFLSVFVLVSPAILVFLWMLSLSFKNEVDNTAWPPVFIPSPPTLANYVEVFARNNFLLYLWNSILVTGGAVFVGLLVGVPAGYGIARSKSAKFAILILIARMTPALSYLIPLFMAFQWLGLVGTIPALLITHLVITIPIIVWIMIGYFENIPTDLEDAALVDGCTPWQSFRYIAFPLAKPGLVVGGILAFIFSWNNFIFSVVLGGKTTRTLPAAVYNVLTFEQLSWGPLAAAALLVTLPVLLLTVLAQRQIVAGLSSGGLKDG
ncbi:ABC transporter permease [Alsobacter metallidurans]|uniref:ABC transporter permease n=1 Tax=Alsobacter metallidurans TaxID=340221 RepID=A0A917I5K3_9HYPH|nr:ABC transporter permease [Alsobacter metallidurans]